ncbi:MAG: polysaccharide biosynthesis C-terminal domain-containing protein, partial [Anaerolineae bacterium]|nr:polysaccharide biosynthesis C-terminal domain-containing protein [Anaerolineae bacterium]
LNILLNLWLIPLYGIEGAAVASLISMLVTNSFAVVFVLRSIRIVPTFVGKFWVR